MRVTTTSSEEREGIEVGPSGKVAMPSSFAEAMRNGEDALETGDYRVAVNAFRQATIISSKDWLAWQRLGIRLLTCSGLQSCASRNRERP